VKMRGAIQFTQGAFGFVIAELVINVNDLLKSSINRSRGMLRRLVICGNFEHRAHDVFLLINEHGAW